MDFANLPQMVALIMAGVVVALLLLIGLLSVAVLAFLHTLHHDATAAKDKGTGS